MWSRPISSLQSLIDLAVQLFPERLCNLMDLAIPDLLIGNGDLLPQPGKFLILIFEQPQSVADDLADGAVAAGFDLMVNKFFKVITE